MWGGRISTCQYYSNQRPPRGDPWAAMLIAGLSWLHIVRSLESLENEFRVSTDGITLIKPGMFSCRGLAPSQDETSVISMCT